MEIQQIRTKQVKNIQIENGPMLVFGGVYSNLQALTKLKTIAEKAGIEPNHIICTGDIVGYCSQPQESINLIREWGIHSIIGNVEEQLREGQEDCGCDFDEGSRCDLFSMQWYPYAKSSLDEEAIEWMETLPDFIRFQFGGADCMVVHGSYFHISEYVFQSTPWKVKEQNFKESGANVILAGHCGLPFHDQKGEYLWLNPGVIGMPANDATSRVWYTILDKDKKGRLRFRYDAFEYDHETTAALMRAKRLPEAYAKTLETGVWDNCEILPDQETAQQGVELVL